MAMGESMADEKENDEGLARVEAVDTHDYKFSSREVDSVFVIGGITDVPAREFSEHLELINAVMYLLEFKYGIDSRTALRDAEKNLDGLSETVRAEICYEIDQLHVSESKFIVAILNAPSTGTGQELERAATLGIPVVALLKMPAKTKRVKNKAYFLKGNDGNIQKRQIHMSDGELSIMVAGNPAITRIISYRGDKIYGITGRIRHSMQKIGWRITEAGFERIGRFLVKMAGDLHVNCGFALMELDDEFQNMGLVPKTMDIYARIAEFEKKRENNGHEKSVENKLLELNAKKDIIEGLLEFDPLRLNHELEKYREFRVHASKTAHIFTKKYSTKYCLKQKI